jgi:hypothetical protein
MGSDVLSIAHIVYDLVMLAVCVGGTISYVRSLFGSAEDVSND